MLFRILGLSTLLSLGCLTVRAQAPINLNNASFKQRLRDQYLLSDTAQAIISLYGRRQGGGASWISSGALAAVRLATTGGQTIGSGPYAVQQEGPGMGEALLFAGPFIGYGVSKLMRYSNKNLNATLDAYATGQPLPASLRRRLKPRFFSQPIIPYQRIPVVPAR